MAERAPYKRSIHVQLVAGQPECRQGELCQEADVDEKGAVYFAGRVVRTDISASALDSSSS